MSDAQMVKLSDEQVKQLIPQLAPEIAQHLVKQYQETGGYKGVGDLLGRREEAAKPVEKGVNMARVLIAYAATGGSKSVPQKDLIVAAAKAFGFVDVSKAVQESVFAQGGAILPPEYTSDVAMILRAANVLEALGARYRPFKRELPLGRQGSGATAYWIDEGEAPTKSDIKYEVVKLKKKKMGVVIDISKDILRDPEAAAIHEQNVVTDIREAGRVKLEVAGITGNGTEKSPKGILNLMDATQKVARTGAGTAADQITDVDKLVRMIKQTERSEEKRGWLFDPIEEAKLLSLRDAAGWVFRDEMLLKGTLRGAAYKTHTAMTAGVRLFGEWADLEYGISSEASIEQSDGLRFLNDEVTVMLVMGGDFQTRRPKSWAATTGN